MRSRSGGGVSSPPKIDQRKFADLLQEIRQLVPFYTPEWQVSEDGDSGSALLKIFSQMVAGTLQRLNRVPEKNFIAFLDMLGVQLLPAQQSRAPVRFDLSKGAIKSVLIPAKTQLSAQSAQGSDSIFFETEKNILVTPAKLVAAYSVNSKRDNIFSSPPGFLTEKQTPLETRLVSETKPNDTSFFLDDAAEIKAGDILKIVNLSNYEYVEVDEVVDRRVNLKDQLTRAYPIDNTKVEKVVNWELFAGKNKQEHILYLGYVGLFNITANVQVTLDLQAENSLTKLADSSLVRWEYWGKDRATQKLKWHSFDNVAVASEQLILEKNNNHEIQEIEINGIKSPWIRCAIVRQSSEVNLPLINDLQEIQINNITVTVDSSAEAETTASPLDYCLTFNNLQYKNKTEESKTGIAFKPFQALEDKHQTIYLGFDSPPLKGPISLFWSLVVQADEESNRLPLNWQYYRRQKEKREWARLNVRDETNSLTQSGTVEFIGPPDFARFSGFGKPLYWIRIVDVEDRFNSQPDGFEQFANRPYISAPKSEGIYLNTTWADQTKTIEREIVGSSNGQADQTFTLFQSPVLSEEVWVNELTALTVEDRQKLLRLAKQDKLQVKEVQDNQGNATQFWVKWQSRADLLESEADDRHYEIDRTFGKIKFGNGTEGAIPPMGRKNIEVTYQVGGGKNGNVARGQINRLNSSIAYINRVTNPEPAQGGADMELLEQALERGPQMLKHRHRAVTAGDFERLSKQASPSVARVKCLPNINSEGKSELGSVTLIVVPESSEAKPQPSLRLKQQVKTYLQQRAVNLVTISKHLYVRSPAYIEIAIATSIIAISLEAVPDIELMTRQKLSAFLHPLTGGYKNRGWAFGRSPCLSDFYALLGSIPGVDRVDSLSIVSSNGKEIQVPPYALVSSGEHQINVTAKL